MGPAGEIPESIRRKRQAELGLLQARWYDGLLLGERIAPEIGQRARQAVRTDGSVEPGLTIEPRHHSVQADRPGVLPRIRTGDAAVGQFQFDGARPPAIVGVVEVLGRPDELSV